MTEAAGYVLTRLVIAGLLLAAPSHRAVPWAKALTRTGDVGRSAPLGGWFAPSSTLPRLEPSGTTQTQTPAPGPEDGVEVQSSSTPLLLFVGIALILFVAVGIVLLARRK